MKSSILTSTSLAYPGRQDVLARAMTLRATEAGTATLLATGGGAQTSTSPAPVATPGAVPLPAQPAVAGQAAMAASSADIVPIQAALALDAYAEAGAVQARPARETMVPFNAAAVPPSDVAPRQIDPSPAFVAPLVGPGRSQADTQFAPRHAAAAQRAVANANQRNGPVPAYAQRQPSLLRLIFPIAVCLLGLYALVTLF